MAENQTNAKQYPETELLLFENYSLSSSPLPSKNDRTSSNKISKRTSISLYDYTINLNENGDGNENRLHFLDHIDNDINRP